MTVLPGLARAIDTITYTAPCPICYEPAAWTQYRVPTSSPGADASGGHVIDCPGGCR